jgi:hypothetical protein
VQVFPAATQCLFVLDMCTSGFGFETLDCLPSMPFALYDFSFLDKALFLKMQPGMRAAVLEGLLTVVNWLRELVNGYGLTLALVRPTAAHFTRSPQQITGLSGLFVGDESRQAED